MKVRLVVVVSVGMALACGSGGSGEVAGSPDAAAPDAGAGCRASDGTLLPELKACTTADDCATTTFGDCCGTVHVVGIAKAKKSDATSCFAAEAEKNKELQCGCPASAFPEAEDGKGISPDAGAARLECKAGRCTTSAP